MPFTGKATYTAGTSLPEIAEDVSDLVAINSPHETPLLDALGDPARSARSTVHEWLEDTLLPNTDTVVSSDESTLGVAHADRFRVGDVITIEGGPEIFQVLSIDSGADELEIYHNYGGTASNASITAGQVIRIIGNAALEGDDAAAARFTSRSRATNYTQILSATVEVSGTQLAVRQLGVSDELDYQKNQRTRELLRDLESSVINGVANDQAAQGNAELRRSMRGIVSFINSNKFTPGSGGFPSGTTLSEEQLNLALRNVWKNSAGNVNLIVVGGPQKRATNGFVASNQRFAVSADENFKSLVNVYESDYGVCRVVLSRYVPVGKVLLLDSSRIDVLPLAGRSFQYKPMAMTGDCQCGLVVGEYTLEFRNESAHGLISGLAA